MNKCAKPIIRLSETEKKIVRKKIELFSMVENLDAALEEIEELKAEIERAKAAWERGDIREFSSAVMASAEEFTDVHVTVGMTLHMMYPGEYMEAVEEKRRRVFDTQLPQHLKAAQKGVIR